MRNIKRKRAKAYGVIFAIISIPVFSVYFASNSPAFNNMTKQATVACAKLAFWGGDKNAPESKNEPETEKKTLSVDFNTAQAVSANSLWSLETAPEEVEVKIPQNEVKVQAPVATPTPTPTPTKPTEINQTVPYPKTMENRSGVIKQVNFTKYSGAQYIQLGKAGQVRNCTSISNDVLINESKKLPEFKIQTNGEPQVLIMHTHTTESYEPYSRDFYDASFNSRTTDQTKSVIAVGNKIEEELKTAGIGVIHDTTIHDYPEYNGSYQRSEVTVKAILAKYPSIKVVLDVHRDAIQTSDGVRTAPIAKINGKQAAQIMIISGCDDGTMNMPNYLKNFRLSSLLQQQLEGDYPGLTRPVLFDYRKYNQDLTTGSILLEMGSNGNSIDEAIYTGELMGKALVKTLQQCK